jgi:hypothetical protein
MDRIGPELYPRSWTGKEYLDHWRLGLHPSPPTKIRGMAAVRELLKVIWDDQVTVEVETSPGVYSVVPKEEVRHFHGGRSLVAGEEEEYRPCRLRFLPIAPAASAKGGRTGYNYAPITVRILTYLDQHGTSKSIDFITKDIRIQMERDGEKPPSYPRLQPFVRELLAYRTTMQQRFSESIPRTEACD